MGIETYDVFVIGTGSSGRTVALACARAGRKVAIADNREYGGVCANRGCDPKKVLVSFTEILERAENMKGKGIRKVPQVSWKDLLQFKSTFTDAVPFVNEQHLKEEGITLYHQSPHFLDSHTLSVEGKTVKVKKVVIATGQKPRSFYFEGSQFMLQSEDFLSLEELPESTVFVGGGFVGMEFAHIAARMGVKVTLIHSHERPLNRFDPDMVDELVKVSEELGIEFVWNAHANKIEKTKSGYKVFTDKKGKPKNIEGELVFNTAGRVPSIEELNLDKGGVTYDKGGIIVNEKLQNPSHKDVYACGDAASSPGLPLTPLAPFEAAVVISQLLDKKDKKKASYPPQPSIVFTLPHVASIGYSEEEAKKELGDRAEVKKKVVSDWYSAKHLQDPVYAYKIITHTEKNTILGAHLVGSGIAETINLFAVSMANKLTVDAIKKTLFAYPTWGNDIKSMF